MTGERDELMQRDIKRIIGKAAGEAFVLAQEAVGQKVIDKLGRAGFTIVPAALLRSTTESDK